MTSPVIDCDSHVLEPADLWETYLEAEFRDRAIRIVDVDGVESLLMGDQVVMAGNLAGLGGVHLDRATIFTGGLRYADGCPPASYDPAARLAMYDETGVDAGLVFPTIGILPFECDDVDLLSAYARAYNRWQTDFAAAGDGRILPVAALNLRDLDGAIAELDRCLDAGFRALFLPPEPVDGVRPGDPAFDPLWARCAEAGVAVCLHVVVRFGGAGVPFAAWQQTGPGLVFSFSLGAPGQLIPAATSMVLDGTFDRHPDLRLVCVEAGCGWGGFLMDRLDEKHKVFAPMLSPLDLKPSEYVQRNIWFVAEPEERTIAGQLDVVGEDRILWGSDYPHIDSDLRAPEQIRASIGGLSAERQAAVLGGNAVDLFGYRPRAGRAR